MTLAWRRFRRAGAALAAVSTLVAGCSSATKPPPVESAPAVDRTYVALGALDDASAADPSGEDQWTQRFFRETLPLGTVLYDLRTSGASVQATIDRQLQEALRLEPDLVTIWLDVSDPMRGLPADEYRRRLAQLVEPLRRGGKTRVLVTNLPPFDGQLRQATYATCITRTPVPQCLAARNLPLTVEESEAARATVTAYNAAVAEVASEADAIVVDLQAASTRTPGDRTLVVGPGSTTPIDHARVAAAFAEAGSA